MTRVYVTPHRMRRPGLDACFRRYDNKKNIICKKLVYHFYINLSISTLSPASGRIENTSMRKYVFLFFIVIAAVSITLWRPEFSFKNPIQPRSHVQAEEPDRTVTVPIEVGNTFGIILEAQGISPETIAEIAVAYEPVYDFASIRAGKELVFVYDHETDALTKIIYEPNSELQVLLEHDANGWHASKDQIVYEIRRKKVSGTIESSLYETAIEQHLDTRAIISLAEAFAWQIDFAVDIRKGDTFSMIYEERYRDGEYVMPGAVLAAVFNNAGIEYKGYYYKIDDDTDGFYDAEGNSLEKIFLKSPLQYRYISSGFTTARIDPINGHTTAHRAIDYAAGYGTPAVSVGDGTVIRSGWNGGYGYSVDVRHNEMYMTRYGHFSRIAVKTGQHVSQGQIVGYVGSTGHSTGPHLHYELYKFGSPINPLTVELPSIEGLSAEVLPAFQEHIKQFKL